jgi:hypothetical protein
MDMIGNVLRKFLLAVTLVASLVIGQEIPIVSPHLLPFPGIKTGLSYFSLKPTQNMEVTSIPGGWTIADTMRGVLASIDLEILRYRWWDHFQPHSKFDAYSSLHYSTRSQIGNINLPSSYPSTLELNGSDLSGFNMNMLIRNFSVANYFAYDYSRRGSLHATLGMGLSHLSLYQNGSGIRTLESTGYHLNFGLGWKMTLFGRLGKRFRLGVDMGYTLEGFNLADQGESLKLPGGASGEISHIQT